MYFYLSFTVHMWSNLRYEVHKNSNPNCLHLSPSQLDFHGESLLAGSSINGCAGCFRGLVQGQRGMWKALPHFFLFSFLNENFPCNFPLLHHSSFSLLRNLLYSLFTQNTLALSPSYKKKLRSSKSKKLSKFPWWYAVTWH